jgi:phosphoribosylformylglycinamidine synthase subunit PurQ / glutaminase
MKFGIVVFPGSNCDRDMMYVLNDLLGQETVYLWHKDRDLQQCDFIILPGGFSYGDYLRSGAIARFSPIMESVIEFASKGGYVMGICNGFQILCEAGLVPGALLHNDSHSFICKNVYIAAQNNETLLTRHLEKGKALQIPIAHGEGRYFHFAEEVEKMNRNGQILFRYCDENGAINDASNPNGSIENIAGVCNETKNVFGMMPHPERAADTILNNQDGLAIFESILEMVK